MVVVGDNEAPIAVASTSTESEHSEIMSPSEMTSTCNSRLVAIPRGSISKLELNGFNGNSFRPFRTRAQGEIEQALRARVRAPFRRGGPRSATSTRLDLQRRASVAAQSRLSR